MTAVTPLGERFWTKVEKSDDQDGCWLWKASLDSKGYGQINIAGKRTRLARAHRLAYEMVVGPIPDGLQLDHLCRNRACVNPRHLEPVTNRENALRSERARRTACIHGHPYTAENTIWKANGRRTCRECDRMRKRGEKP